MNINDLPEELLEYIFSYLTLSELLLTASNVCSHWNEACLSPSLWKQVTLHSDCKIDLTFELFCQINTYTRTLITTNERLNDIFEFRLDLFLTLKSLHITNHAANEVIEKVACRCQNLEDIRITSGIDFNMRHALNMLSNLDLKVVDLCYMRGDMSADKQLLQFLNKQPHLTKLSLTKWIGLKYATIGAIFNDYPNIKSVSLPDDVASTSVFTRTTNSLSVEEISAKFKYIDDFGIECLSLRSKHLRVLDLQRSSQITNISLCQIAENCSMLETLCIGNNKIKRNYISNRGIKSLAEGCKHLRQISLMDFTAIDDESIIPLSECCRKLEHVTLTTCLITDKSLYALGMNCKHLSYLDLSKNVLITMSGVITLLKLCRAVEVLNLSSCVGICEVASLDNKIESIQHSDIRVHSHVKHLFLELAINISEQAVMQLVKMCCDLRSLNLRYVFKRDKDLVCRIFNACRFLTMLEISDTWYTGMIL